MNGPKQEPDNNPPNKWESWQDHKLEGKTSEFQYSDSTSEHIGGGESQKFHYGNQDLPEKE